VGIHAQPRATKDLDILVRRGPENAARVYEALAQFGAPLEGWTPADLVEPGFFFRMGREPVAVDILSEIAVWTLMPHGNIGSKLSSIRRVG
jgi:hypothetical protein